MTIRCPYCHRQVPRDGWRVKRPPGMFDESGRPVALWRCLRCQARIVRRAIVSGGILAATKSA